MIAAGTAAMSASHNNRLRRDRSDLFFTPVRAITPPGVSLFSEVRYHGHEVRGAGPAGGAVLNAAPGTGWFCKAPRQRPSRPGRQVP